MAQGEEDWTVQYTLNGSGVFEMVGPVQASNPLVALQRAITKLAEDHPELSQERSGLNLFVRPGK